MKKRPLQQRFFSIRPLLLILLAVLLLRIPNLFEPYWYGDEGIYLSVGEGLRQGLTLYRDIFDHKPPAIYLVAALAGSLFWFKFILLVWHLATIVVFWKFVRKFFAQSSILDKDQPKVVSLTTAFFALLTTIPFLEGHIANAELFMAGPVLVGLNLLFSKEKFTYQTLVISGFIFSIGVLFKIPAAFDVFAVICFWFFLSLWDFKKIFEAIKNSIFLGIGVIFPFILFGIYFAAKGSLRYFLEGTFSQNISYIASWSTPETQIASSSDSGLFLRALVLGISLIVVLLVKKFLDRATLFAIIWLLFALFALLLSGRPYPHYLIQAVAPVAILLGLLFYGSQNYRFWTVPVILLFLFAVNFYKFYYYPTLPYYSNFIKFATKQISQEEYFKNFDQRVITTYKVAKYLSVRVPAKERVFIWGTEPELYALSRHVPPGRFVTSFHIVDFGAKKETLKSLQENPPRYIIRMESEAREFPEFEMFLMSRYIYTENIDNAQIWKLIDPSFAKLLR